MIDTVTITVNAFEPTYRFQIELSDLEMERLSRESLLGISFKKNKYLFLNDLADILAQEILVKLEEIIEAQS